MSYSLNALYRNEEVSKQSVQQARRRQEDFYRKLQLVGESKFTFNMNLIGEYGALLRPNSQLFLAQKINR
ncbi:hypothetical protein BFP72_08485 [Reichenbachiella sp. 5M10]|uniref:hypothetical protein n=1 Tax=Reichenbachiella sp. 5M10 TaxID=1889772 RepID=UPI000C368831|nr:hypothetical protein [Reichenbachiella sp. 5M10]PIB35429.1 hypothetical protein BFP72_08485 [Reichenbachiella sp. 5M10]